MPFTLLRKVGQRTNDGHPYGPITGIGIEEACEVAMRANMVYLGPSSQYIDSREAWISAATDLGHPAATVEAVWDACGVVPPPPPCDSPIFTENFEEAWPPVGWAVIYNGGDCNWESNASAGIRTNNTGGGGNCAIADSDSCGLGSTMNTELRTPEIDLSTASSATLEFKTDYYNYFSLDFAYVDISTNGGSSWTNLLTWNTSRRGPDFIQIDITPYVGSPNTIIRFHYYAPGWDLVVGDRRCKYLC